MKQQGIGDWMVKKALSKSSKMEPEARTSTEMVSSSPWSSNLDSIKEEPETIFEPKPLMDIPMLPTKAPVSMPTFE